jgi:hypothetical protein
MAQINMAQADENESKRPRRPAGRALNISVLEELRSLKQELQDSL